VREELINLRGKNIGVQSLFRRQALQLVLPETGRRHQALVGTAQPEHQNSTHAQLRELIL
jgi:hypothetical protein